MDFNAIVYATYVSALLVVCFVAFGAWGRFLALDPLQRTAAAVAANWAVNTFYVLSTQIYDPWWWFILTDAIAARIVLHQPASKAQAAIGWVYMAQIVMHVVYFASNSALAAPRYWQVLIALAFVQLLILGGWTIGGIARRAGLRRRPRSPAQARHEGVAR